MLVLGTGAESESEKVTPATSDLYGQMHYASGF